MGDSNQTHFGFQTVSLKDKVSKVTQVFTSVADSYDLMNDVMSLGLHRIMKQFTVEMSAARDGHRILDLAGGTGDLSAKLSPIVGQRGMVILCDINSSMLTRGRDKLIDKGLVSNVLYVQADAEQLPFPDNYFNCITIAFGLRNIANKEVALRSMSRTLQPGGRLLVLDFSKPKNQLVEKAYKTYSSFWPAIGELIAGDKASYQYLLESIELHPDQTELKDMIEDAGFSVEFYNLLGGIAAIHKGIKA